MKLISRGLFAIYKQIISFAIHRSFKSHVVFPLTKPIDERIALVPFSEGTPAVGLDKLFTMKNFSAADHAPERMNIIERNKFSTGILGKLNRPAYLQYLPITKNSSFHSERQPATSS